jgi:sortase A
VTHGAPFTNIDGLKSCDPLVVETATAWFVYRVLPMSNEVLGWAAGKGAQENCRGVAPLPPPYRDVPGQQIVTPDAVSVVGPESMPTSDVGIAPAAHARLITLTTCHPRFSARQRLIVHGVLVAQYPRTGQRPPELGAEVIQ